MDLLNAFKALANPARLKILSGLKDPERSFPAQDEGDVKVDGVCVSSIQEGMGLSQSTTSQYMSVLSRAGLVVATRRGKWTYYKRNEVAIRQLAAAIGTDL